MINWLAISDDDGFTIAKNIPVLLIARYPTGGWSDPVYGWRDEIGFARWKHDFPPTHFAHVNTPEGN